MKVEREVIVDLLPAYFSGEASAATRALVEDCFREDPEFEKFARSAGRPLESLKVLAPGLDPEKEKLALERARLVVETRSSFFWLAVFFTLMLGLFRVHDHKIVWVLWEPVPSRGIVFSILAVFFWLIYFKVRSSKDPLPARVKFLWTAVLYSLLPFLFDFKDHKVNWIFSRDPEVAYIFGAIALIQWGLFFYYYYWKSGRTDT